VGTVQGNYDPDRRVRRTETATAGDGKPATGMARSPSDTATVRFQGRRARKGPARGAVGAETTGTDRGEALFFRDRRGTGIVVPQTREDRFAAGETKNEVL